MKSRLLICLLFLEMFFYACSNTKTENTTTAYFDLKTYFKNQAVNLAANKFRIRKTVIKEETVAEKMFENPDWNSELNPFSECDINRPSWKNSYLIDSTGNAELYCIKYSAKDSVLKIKSINFCIEHDSITFISIEKRTDNIYYNNITTLNYYPMKAYAIQNSQKISFAKGSEIEVKAIFFKQ